MGLGTELCVGGHLLCVLSLATGRRGGGEVPLRVTDHPTHQEYPSIPLIPYKWSCLVYRNTTASCMHTHNLAFAMSYCRHACCVWLHTSYVCVGKRQTQCISTGYLCYVLLNGSSCAQEFIWALSYLDVVQPISEWLSKR